MTQLWIIIFLFNFVHSKDFQDTNSWYKDFLCRLLKQFITCSLPVIWICEENYGNIRIITSLNKQLHKKFHEKAKLKKLRLIDRDRLWHCQKTLLIFVQNLQDLFEIKSV